MATGNYERAGGLGALYNMTGPSVLPGQYSRSTEHQRYGRSVLGLGEGNVTGRQYAPYEDPSRWGEGLAPVVTSFADLARAVRGERTPEEPPPTDYGVPGPTDESFFSTPGGIVVLVGGLAAGGLLLYYALKKPKASAAKTANRRRRNRRRRNSRRGTTLTPTRLRALGFEYEHPGVWMAVKNGWEIVPATEEPWEEHHSREGVTGLIGWQLTTPRGTYEVVDTLREARARVAGR